MESRVAESNAVISQIGDLAEAGEKMIERLRRKAFRPESRKGLNVRTGIAEAAQLLGCSTNRIRMAEEDGRLPPPPAGENGREPSTSTLVGIGNSRRRPHPVSPRALR